MTWNALDGLTHLRIDGGIREVGSLSKVWMEDMNMQKRRGGVWEY